METMTVSRWDTLREVLAEQAQTERTLRWKHKGFDLWYNWAIAILVILMWVAIAKWGMDIRAERKGAEMVATAQAAWEAEQTAAAEQAEAEALAVRQSQEFVMKQEAEAMAKAFFGIRNFVEKYHYSEKDFETYARCMFNRADAGSGRLTEVIAQEGQFLAYSDNNTVLSEYYDMAYRFVQAWHEETSKPCDTSYQFAELTPSGIYLTNVFGADGYARRWQA